MSTSLSLNGVTKVFSPDTPDEKIALNHVDFNVNPGDFITLLGSNGAGKSTLFNLITGELMPDTGSIFLGDTDVTNLPQHKRARDIGCLFQNPLRGTAPDLTIAENLALVYSRHAKTGLFALNKKNIAVFRELLSTLDMGLEDRMHTKMGQLSGGQRQAASLLMATCASPKILLLDEHTAALDPAAAEKIMHLTCEIVARDKITTLMITHDMSDALAYGNRTVMMDAGRIVYDVSGEERKHLTPDGLVTAFRMRALSDLGDRTMLK